MGWIAGLANAFPAASAALFERAMELREGRGSAATVEALYTWFLPLLRMDTVPKFVQLIKLVQAMVVPGWSPRVRPPRLELEGAELEEAQETIRFALDHLPVVGGGDY